MADEAVAETFAQLLRRGEAVEDPAAWAWRTAFRIAAADRAIEKAPLESDNYVIKGSVYRNLAKAGGAKSNIFIAAALYRQALGLNRLNLHALRDLIDCHLMLGDERRARYYINRYLSLVDDPKIEAIRRNIR